MMPNVPDNRSQELAQIPITHVETGWLDGKHTVFGRVLTGQDVVDAVKQGDTLNSVKIEEK